MNEPRSNNLGYFEIIYVILICEIFTCFPDLNPSEYGRVPVHKREKEGRRGLTKERVHLPSRPSYDLIGLRYDQYRRYKGHFGCSYQLVLRIILPSQRTTGRVRGTETSPEHCPRVGSSWSFEVESVVYLRLSRVPSDRGISSVSLVTSTTDVFDIPLVDCCLIVIGL